VENIVIHNTLTFGKGGVMNTLNIIKDNDLYFMEDSSGNRVELKWAKGKEGKILRLPKNASNRKKFSISKMEGDKVELTFKPQNTEKREFSIISKKLLKYATPAQLEAIARITAATKEAWDAAKAVGGTGKVARAIDPSVAAEMLPKLEKKYASLGARIARYKEILGETVSEVEEGGAE
jgi:hypothetical protein